MIAETFKNLNKQGEYPELDGLRAIAVLLVIFSHIFQIIPGLSYVFWKTEWTTPLFNGWSGVDLFFVLSGFLIGGQILKKIERGDFSFRNFYLRRAFRILPAYFALLALVTALALFYPNFYSVVAIDTFSFKALIKNLLLVCNYFPSDIGVASWSLSVEEQFYWVIPLVCLLLRQSDDTKKARTFAIIWGLALLFRMLTYRYYDIGPDSPILYVTTKTYYPFHNRMDALAAGVLTYIALKASKGTRSSVGPSIARYMGGFLLAFTILTGGLKGGWLETTLQYSLLSLGFASLTWGVLAENNLNRSNSKRFLSSRAWVPIARLSYSLYLVHILAIRIVLYYFKDHQDTSSPWMPLWMIFLSGVGAIVLFFSIEYPFYRWAKTKFN